MAFFFFMLHGGVDFCVILLLLLWFYEALVIRDMYTFTVMDYCMFLGVMEYGCIISSSRSLM